MSYLILLLVVILAGNAAGVPFDRIVAVVDDEIILQSDMNDLESMYKEQPPFNTLSEEALRKQILEKLIDEKVMLAIAKRDTDLTIMEGEIEPRVKMHLARIMEENGGQERFETLLKQTNGMTMQAFKDQISEQFKEQTLKQKLQEKYCGFSDPSSLQIKEFYKDYRDSLPVYKNNFRISHLEMGVKANPELVKRTYKTCDSLIGLLEKGEAFEELAKKFSDDPSGEDGGDLGFTKRGVLDPAYEKVAFRMAVGEYSSRPVRSQYGFHIIKVTAKRDIEIRTSHILIRLFPTQEDTLRTIALLDSIKGVISEKKNFPEMAKRFSEDKKTRDAGGVLGWFTENSLNPEYQAIIDSLAEGQISPPHFINDKYHLFRLDEYQDERKLTLEDDWEQISMIAKNYLLNKKLNVFLEKWKKEVHIENRMDKSGHGE
ncbi:peptidylprolyl isomerase [Fibrobacterota bacterium]